MWLFKFNRTKERFFIFTKKHNSILPEFIFEGEIEGERDKSLSRLISIYDFHYYKISASLNTMMILETKKKDF